jgi:glucose-1-phosphate thymidylyltransferase
MIDKGAKIQVIDVEGWYDAGKIETILETNQTMLEKGRARRPAASEGVTIVDPVYIEDNVSLTGSTVGPNVSIGAGSVIENSTVSHSIVGTGSRIKRSTISNSLIGDDTVLDGVNGEVTVGDHSEVKVSPNG